MNGLGCALPLTPASILFQTDLFSCWEPAPLHPPGASLDFLTALAYFLAFCSLKSTTPLTQNLRSSPLVTDQPAHPGSPSPSLSKKPWENSSHMGLRAVRFPQSLYPTPGPPKVLANRDKRENASIPSRAWLGWDRLGWHDLIKCTAREPGTSSGNSGSRSGRLRCRGELPSRALSSSAVAPLPPPPGPGNPSLDLGTNPQPE